MVLFAVVSFVPQEDTEVSMIDREALNNCMPDLHNPVKE